MIFIFSLRQIDPEDWPAVKEDGMLPISTVKGYGLRQLVTCLAFNKRGS
jgi:hypothetical protein